MIRALTAAPRSIPFPIYLCIQNRSADAISHPPFARCFNSYAQPFPYYQEPVGGRYQPEPFPRHYADPFGYQSDNNFGPGANSRDSRLGHPFRGQFESYPVNVSWRGYGPECYCRCCGRPFWGYHHHQPHKPVNYRGDGFQGMGYDHGRRYDMRSDYYRNHSGSGFSASDGRSYGGSSSYYPRNPNVNAGQHGQNWGGGHCDRIQVPQEKWPEEQNIVNDGYNYREYQNGGGDGRDHNVWSRSRSNYNQYGQYGPEHSVYRESDKFHRRTEHAEQKNSLPNDQNSGKSVVGQSQDVAVNGHLMNSDGARGEFQHARRSAGISDNHHGSREGNQNVNMQTSRNYYSTGVWGKYGDQALNNRYYENSNGFSQNPNVSHGHNSNVDPNGGKHQDKFNAANISEAGRIFPDDHIFKQDTFKVGYEQTKDVNSLQTPNGPLLEFAATNQPLKSTATSFGTNQIADINDSRSDLGGRAQRMGDFGNNVSHRSNVAVGRCQRIIDVLGTEDKDSPKGPGSRSVSQSRNKYSNRLS